MTKLFYEWQDLSDRHATGRPDLERYEWSRATTKKEVREEVRDYLASFPDIKNPKIVVWKISYSKVKI